MCRSIRVALTLTLLWPSCAVAQVAGVTIDADGLLSVGYSRRESASVAAKRMQAFALQSLPDELSRAADLRKVSLRRLEAALQSAGSISALPPATQSLYGLQRVDDLFIDREAGDVILAGPAEPFAPDATGRTVGLASGRPTLQLDDLLVALRWGARTRGRGDIGCSIDPAPERQAAMQQWIAANSNAVSRDVAQQRYTVMAGILGRQAITVMQVPDDSHFARVLVEADYRMKLIALGKAQPGVKGLRSQLSLLTPQGNNIQRWWFTPLYDPIAVDEAGTSYHLSGQRLQLLAQDEWADGRGRRSDSATSRVSTERFAKQFTDHIPELAAREPLFAELQNLFDLAIVAAILQQDDWPQRLDWDMRPLLDEMQFPTQQLPVPKFIDSLATTTNRNRFVLGLVGGVTLSAGRVATERQTASLPGLRSNTAEKSDSAIVSSRPWWD
ncbi:MAG: DUF1598 domain-containing protein [Planctomycetaceae bacterium]